MARVAATSEGFGGVGGQTELEVKMQFVSQLGVFACEGARLFIFAFLEQFEQGHHELVFGIVLAVGLHALLGHLLAGWVGPDLGCPQR